MLKNRKILLAVTGSIAAYKSPDIARSLIKLGADVRVVMTDAACRFIQPYTFESLTGNPVYNDLFKDPFSHLTLPADADLLVIAPVTANTINKLSIGIADNMLSNIWLAYKGPVVMAPAMNERMFRHKTVQQNIMKMKKDGVCFVGPERGRLACGETGEGKMSDIDKIIETIVNALSVKDFKGLRLLVSAGPTRETIDPVRYISNRSSGKMGYAIARSAYRRGADVTLVSGPSAESVPDGIKLIPVESASEMLKAVTGNIKGKNVLVMAAAVSDYAPAERAKKKHDKNMLNSLILKKTPDILKKLSKNKGRCMFVGFAAETGMDIDRAKGKLKSKKLDIIVLNDVTQKGAGFDVDTNIVTLIDRNGNIKEYPLMQKTEVADVILDKILELKSKKKS